MPPWSVLVLPRWCLCANGGIQNASESLQLPWPNTAAFSGSAKIFSTKDLWRPVQTYLSISLSTLVHRFCRVPGRSSSLGSGKNWASLSKPAALSECLFSIDNQISNLNCLRWRDEPLKREVSASGGNETGSHVRHEATKRMLRMTAVIVALCLSGLMIILDDTGEGRATPCF